MKTLTRMALLFAAASLFSGRCFAVLGMGDVVIVASNPAQELLWATSELPKWVELIGKTQEQIRQAEKLVDRVGDPTRFAAEFVDASAPAVSAARRALALPTEKSVRGWAKEAWHFSTPHAARDDQALAVAATFKALGREEQRERSRYVELAAQKALAGRVTEAIARKREVDEAEFAFQEETLLRLKAASTETEITTHQANLAASEQRVGLAAARVEQAQRELDLFAQERRVEAERRRAQSDEWATAVLTRSVDAARQAARAGGRRPVQPIGEDNWHRWTD